MGNLEKTGKVTEKQYDRSRARLRVVVEEGGETLAELLSQLFGEVSPEAGGAASGKKGGARVSRDAEPGEARPRTVVDFDLVLRVVEADPD